MIRVLLLVAVAVVALINGDAATDKCKPVLQTYVQCIKAEVKQRLEADHKNADPSVQPDVAKCFTASGCTAPDFTAPLDQDLDTKGKNQWKTATEWWDKLDTDKRHCAVSEARGSYKQKLQECVNTKIPGFTITEPTQDEVKQAPEFKDKTKKLGEFRFRVRVAMKKCPKRDDVSKCLQKLRAEKFDKEACATRVGCAAKVDAECKKLWNSRLKAPICTCAHLAADALKKDANNSTAKWDEAIKAKCNVEIPQVDPASVDKETHNRLKEFVAVHEDRVLPFCHDCPGADI